MKNGIVIPCYNDETNFDLNAIERFIDCNSRTIICFVINGSMDNTSSLLKNFQRQLLNSHKCLATQVLVLNSLERMNEQEVIWAGRRHLKENTMVKDIFVSDGRFQSMSEPMQKLNSDALRYAA